MEEQTLVRYLTIAEIEAGLAELGASPHDHGRVEMIVRRPGTSLGEREILEKAELDLTQGLVGDDWLARGSEDMPDGRADPEAQVTLINSRILQSLTQDRARWPRAGNQFYVDLDLSAENVPPGQRLAIGAAVLEVSSLPHTGCAMFTEWFGSEATRFVNSAEGRRLNRRGINTRVVQPGTVRAGDTVSKIRPGS